MQPRDPSGRYSDAAVLAALQGRSGVRTLTFRFDRLSSSNVLIEPVDWVVEGKVTNNALADIKRQASFRILDRGGFNYLSDRIKPWARLRMPDGGYVEWPLGVFLLESPSRKLKGTGVIERDVKAFDQLTVLAQDRIPVRASRAAGTLYTDVIAQQAGFAGVSATITPSASALPVAMEWEPGTPRLRIINDMLAAINYESAWFDENGSLIARPYLSPSDRTPEYVYDDDAVRSVIAHDELEQALDIFDVPNQWTLVVSEGDRPPLSTTYTNNSPNSPTSTVARGRTITDFRDGEDAADLATLEAKARRLAFEASQVVERITFDTLLMPLHSNADVLQLRVPDLGVDGIYSEQSWELPLKAGARMSHTVRRVVAV